MPIVFETAQPFAPKISEQFGAAQQWNQIAPLIQRQYEAAAERRSRESIATANNQTQASAVSAGLEARNIAQQRDIEADMQARQYQAQAQMEMQQREQQFDLMRMQIPISRQEEMQNQARMNGLVEIERMEKANLMTKEQAADARYELITGINAFQRRQQYQQAQHYKQQAQLETQRFDLANKNQMTAEAAQAELAKKGVYSWYETDPRTGETHFNVYNPKTGEIYNPRSAGGRGEAKEQTVSQYADPSGGFSYAKALKEAKAEAEVAYPVMKNEEGRDSNADARAKYMQEVVDKYADQHRSGMEQKARVTAPQQNIAPQQNPVQGNPAEGIKQQLRAIKAQFPNGNPTPEAKKQYDQLLAQLESMQR